MLPPRNEEQGEEAVPVPATAHEAAAESPPAVAEEEAVAGVTTTTGDTTGDTTTPSDEDAAADAPKEAMEDAAVTGADDLKELSEDVSNNLAPREEATLVLPPRNEEQGEEAVPALASPQETVAEAPPAVAAVAAEKADAGVTATGDTTGITTPSDEEPKETGVADTAMEDADMIAAEDLKDLSEDVSNNLAPQEEATLAAAVFNMPAVGGDDVSQEEGEGGKGEEGATMTVATHGDKHPQEDASPPEEEGDATITATATATEPEGKDAAGEDAATQDDVDTPEEDAGATDTTAGELAAGTPAAAATATTVTAPALPAPAPPPAPLLPPAGAPPAPILAPKKPAPPRGTVPDSGPSYYAVRVGYAVSPAPQKGNGDVGVSVLRSAIFLRWEDVRHFVEFPGGSGTPLLPTSPPPAGEGGEIALTPGLGPDESGGDGGAGAADEARADGKRSVRLPFHHNVEYRRFEELERAERYLRRVMPDAVVPSARTSARARAAKRKKKALKAHRAAKKTKIKSLARRHPVATMPNFPPPKNFNPPTKKWEAMFKLAQEYRKTMGNLDVPTENTPEEHVELAKWIRYQRTSCEHEF